MTASTNFSAGTVVTSNWLNAVDSTVFDDVFNVKNYGAIGNGTTDDTTAIQDAIDAAEANGGGLVLLPPGTYLVSDTLIVDNHGVRIIGSGMWNTTIKRTTDYGDTLFFSGNETTGDVVVGVGVEELGFLSTGLTTSGAHVRFNGAARVNVVSIYFRDGFIGIQADGLMAASISNIYLVFSQLYGGSSSGRRYMQFGAATAFPHPSSGDVFISDFNVRSTTSANVIEYGININAADGLWFSNGHVGNTVTANIRIAGPTTDILNLIWFDTVFSDEGTGSGLIFDSYAGLGFRTVQFSNCLFKSSGSPVAYADNGIVIASGCTMDGLYMNNCVITEYGGTGVSIQSTTARNMVFSNCIVRGNGRNAVDTYPGYNLLAGVKNVSIIGGIAGQSHASSAVGTQSYGIQFSTGHENIIVSGVNLTGNTLGSVNGGTTVVGVLDNCLTQESTTIASATTLTIPTGGDVFTISGTTNIEQIPASRAGRRITLIFQGVLTVVDGSNLKIAGNFTTTADDCLTLVSDGTNWIETSRSAN